MEKATCATCNTEIRPQLFYTRSTFPPMEGTQLICPTCLEKARRIAASPPSLSESPPPPSL